MCDLSMCLFPSMLALKLTALSETYLCAFPMDFDEPPYSDPIKESQDRNAVLANLLGLVTANTPKYHQGCDAKRELVGYPRYVSS